MKLWEMNDKDARIKWDNILMEAPEYNFFQSYDNSYLRQFNGDSTLFYLLTDELGDILITAMVVVGNEQMSIPFGPIIYKPISQELLFNCLKQIQKEYNLPLQFSIEDMNKNKFPFVKDLENIWTYSTLLLELDDMEQIMKGFNQNRRRIIRKTLKNLNQSIISNNPNEVENFYNMYCDRLKITGGEVDFSLEELEYMLKCPSVELHMCKMDEVDLAGIVSFRFGNTLINRYNCTNTDFLNLNPNCYLDYTLIKQGTEDDTLRYYDFSGYADGENISPKEANINRYKLSYGPQKKLKYRWYKL